jgi:hypothetical protein
MPDRGSAGGAAVRVEASSDHTFEGDWQFQWFPSRETKGSIDPIERLGG